MLLSELWKACALPWKLVAIESACRGRAAAWRIAVTASPIALPGARLKLSVTDGNWPWWLTASGAIEGLTLAN